MKIAFLDFWPGFQPKNNFFFYLLRDSFEKVKLVRPRFAEVIFFSCFGDEHKDKKFEDKKKIYYTGENISPDFDQADISLSFEFNDYEGKNFRLPLWVLHIDWFNAKTYNNPDWLIPKKYLNSSNPFFFKNKNKFCSIVYSTESEQRKKIIDLISTIEKVDVYGKVEGGEFLREGEYEKLNVLSNFNFSLALENSISSGYHTEKLLHAKVAGNIPLYYGADTVSEDFNKNSFINITSKNTEEIIEIVNELQNDRKKRQSILEEPFFNKDLDLNDLSNFVSKFLS